jgi:knotted carbamoyltransferase YgeW
MKKIQKSSKKAAMKPAPKKKVAAKPAPKKAPLAAPKKKRAPAKAAAKGIAIPKLDGARIEALRGKSLLATLDWSTPEIETLLSVMKAMNILDFAGKKLDLLPAELAYALFFDQSTRTKSAWAGAASRLGMQPVIVDGKSTQLSHGETGTETGAMLGMNAHALGVRHDLILGEGRKLMKELDLGIRDYLAATKDPRSVPIVNLQCDLDHPTQTLADLYWLKRKLGSLAGKKIAVSWAYSPSYAKPLSVPQGLIFLLTRFGAEVTLAHPKGYSLLPECMDAANRFAGESGGKFRVVDSMDEAFSGADAVYPKSWGPLELMEARVNASKDAAKLGEIEKAALERNARHRDWITDERRMGLTKNGEALYLHCLPADIGAEVTPGVMEKARIDLAEEANGKVYVIMALLAMSKVPDLAAKLARIAKGA